MCVIVNLERIFVIYKAKAGFIVFKVSKTIALTYYSELIGLTLSGGEGNSK